MNAKMKKRLVLVTGIVVIVLIVVLAVIGGGTSATTVTVAQAASGDYADKRVQVTGSVVDNSYETKNGVLTFDIYDPDGDAAQTVRVSYDGGVTSTFGNGVTAICTGKMLADGSMQCSELVTKCPSKYESGTDAIDVAQLLEYGADIVDTPVKITGVVRAGSLNAAGQGERFVLSSVEGDGAVAVTFDGALSEEIDDESTLVVTGQLCADGTFAATDVAIQQ